MVNRKILLVATASTEPELKNRIFTLDFFCKAILVEGITSYRRVLLRKFHDYLSRCREVTEMFKSFDWHTPVEMTSTKTAFENRIVKLDFP